jgi:hypothetical protein
MQSSSPSVGSRSGQRDLLSRVREIVAASPADISAVVSSMLFRFRTQEDIRPVLVELVGLIVQLARVADGRDASNTALFEDVTEAACTTSTSLQQLREQLQEAADLRERMAAVERQLASAAAESAVMRGNLEELQASMSVVEEGMLLLRNVGARVADSIREGGSASCLSTSGRSEPLGGTFVRCWQSEGSEKFNVVVRVSAVQRAALLRASAALRREDGVVVAPYLTRLGAKLRKDRQAVFDKLLGQGLKPRWRKGVEIEFYTCGGWTFWDWQLDG